MTWGCDHRGTLGRPLIPTLVHDASMPSPLAPDETDAVLKAKKQVWGSLVCLLSVPAPPPPLFAL